jgi:hypothetical protein
VDTTEREGIGGESMPKDWMDEDRLTCMDNSNAFWTLKKLTKALLPKCAKEQRPNRN